jgi:CHAT domain-containing protein
LRNPQTERYLIEDYTLTYAPSASALRFLRAKETPVEGQSLILGAPVRPESELEPLSGMTREVKTVARLLRTTPLLGSKATESRLYAKGGKPDLLHIAAHGSYDSSNPLFSRLALTPGDQQDGSLRVPENQHDGNLEVHEILGELDLSGVNLVVLSACETARGVRSGGDEITSLTRAFLYAGSPGVISTLWKIDDAASTLLIEELYRNLLNGVSVAEALRQAQLSVLQQPEYRHPGFWAAFSLTGDPQGRWRISP